MGFNLHILQIVEIANSIATLSDELTVGDTFANTSLYLSFLTHSGYDYTSLQPGSIPAHPVSYQAYILASSQSVLTQMVTL